MQGQQPAKDPAARAVHGHFYPVQSAQHIQALDADDGGDAQLTRGNGRVAGVAAHVGHDG